MLTTFKFLLSAPAARRARAHQNRLHGAAQLCAHYIKTRASLLTGFQMLCMRLPSAASRTALALAAPVAMRRLHRARTMQHGGHNVSNQSLSAQKRAVAAQGSEPLNRITTAGAVINVVLALGKGVAGVLGNSAAMIADAAHSLSDLLSDFVTLYVLKEAHKPADADHPYGHGKYESIGSLSLAAVLVGTGAAIGLHSIHLLQELSVATAEAAAAAAPTSLAAVAAVVSVLVKEALYHATVRVGTQHNSSVVVMNAWHHRADGLTSLVALAGIGGSMLGFPLADPIAGVLVAGMIVKIGVQSGVESFRDLTDQQVEGATRTQLEAVLAREKGVRSFHKLRLRATGPTVVADVHIVVDPLLSVSAAHQIAELARFNVMSAMPVVSDLLVHIDVDEDGDVEDRLDKGDLARPVVDIEADIRRIAARFDAFVKVSTVTCHVLHGAAVGVSRRHIRAVLKVRVTPSVSLETAGAAASSLRSALLAEVADVRDASIDVDLSRLTAPLAEAAAPAAAPSNT